MIAKNSSIQISRKNLNGVERLARKWISRRLQQIRSGKVFIHDGERNLDFEANDFGAESSNGLHASIYVTCPRFYRRALGGTNAIAKSYIDGDWECSDLSRLFRLFLRNRDAIGAQKGLMNKIVQLVPRVSHWLNRNTRYGSQKNIAAHYDLGNDFYRLWLDETMAYSSGIFSQSDMTLEEASSEKFDRVCRKLELAPKDQVLEIGCGWGGFALHAARNYGCQITATTLSQQQFVEASERIKKSSFEDSIRLVQEDYRNLTGKYDKLISIEMIEAVGHQFLDQYFRKCSQLLREDGSMVIQAIVMPEANFAQYKKSVDFIQRFVFPGGFLPSLSCILESVGRTTDMRFVHAEDMAPHYAETLRRWRKAFEANIDQVRAMGYPESFVRTWRYYLNYCEAAFEERYIGVLQIQLDKPKCRRDPIEISDSAASLRTVESRGDFQRFAPSARFNLETH